MFKKRKGYTKYEVRSHVELDGNEFIFDCYIPPIGYGINVITGEEEKTDVLKRSQNKKEQFWERTPMPADWKQRIAEEKKIRTQQEARGLPVDYLDTVLSAFEKQEWKRRLCGVWFYNNGEPTYITGMHYMYLNWWPFQGKLLDYRKYDKDFFYIWRYCEEDENCIGLNYITKRKSGKTAKAGIIIYERTSRTSNAHAGIQSKGDGDAEEVFKKAIIAPWKKLPYFFKPIYDTAAGDSPSKELRFFKPAQKGKKALDIDYDEVEELESWIDFGSSGVDFYDGPELDTYYSDESGKLKRYSILDRHNTVIPCCEIDGIYKGKMLHTTTIEKDDEKDNDLAASEYKKLIELSDPFKRDGNGRTLSGLYNLFLPAFETMYFDRYGEPDVKKAKEFFLARRKALENTPKELASYIRKNPFSLREAFDMGSDKCHFNAILLKNVISTLEWSGKSNYEQGNIEYIDGISYSQDNFKGVYWVKTKQGRWFKRKDFEQPINAYIKRGASFYPGNKIRFAIACDPYQLDITEDTRNSKLASHVKQRFAPEGIASPLHHAYVLRYYSRPKLVAMSHEDMIKQCLFTGSDILIENAKDGGMIKTFDNNGMNAFLQKLPGKENYGVYPDENNKMLALGRLSDFFEQEVAEDHYKMLHEQDVEQCIKFDVHKTEKTDAVMSLLWTEVADLYKTTLVKKEKPQYDVSDFFGK